MITLALFNETHIALHGAYEQRDAIKALAPPPDVRWCAEAKAWLMHVALLDKLFFYLGDAIAPASVDFWCTCPVYAPTPAQPRRRSTREIMAEKQVEHAAAGRFGATIVEYMHKESGK